MENQIRAPASRRSSRLNAQSLRSGVSPDAERVPDRKALRVISNHSGGLAPTASGANSLASALGSLPRRDPGEAVRTYHEGCESTLKIGTFYLAGNRNFLLGSDTEPLGVQPEDGGSRAASQFQSLAAGARYVLCSVTFAK